MSWSFSGHCRHQVNEQFHVYFSAKSNTNQRFCLGVARSESFEQHQRSLQILESFWTFWGPWAPPVGGHTDRGHRRSLVSGSLVRVGNRKYLWKLFAFTNVNWQRSFPISNIFHRNSFPYIIWKTDDNAEGKASRIFIRRVATLFSENITPVVQIELCVGFWGWSHIPRGSDHPDLGGGQRRGAERCRGTLDPLQVAETP